MTTTYMFNKTNRTNIMSMQRQALSIINSFFASLGGASNSHFIFSENKMQKLNSSYQSLVGKPVFSVNPDKVVVQLFYYWPHVTGQPTEILSNASIAALGDALTRCWGRTVELRLVRINHSALDSSIFAQYLTANGGKYSFNRILDMLKSSLPTVVSEGSVVSEDGVSATPTSHITGVKIKLSGRLTTQRSGPRQTVQAGRIGSSAKGQFGTVDYSKHTAKNKLGAFTMKVWISQQSR